jgi:hypothetical protein
MTLSEFGALASTPRRGFYFADGRPVHQRRRWVAA